jgi:thiol-disulfide isomerase/thioredoxin
MFSPDFFKAAFSQALPFDRYVATGQLHEQPHWKAFHERITLTNQQRGLLGSFKRKLNGLCLSGTWCGDCVQQCPIYDHIARAAPEGIIDLRFLDRDALPELASAAKICGGSRVPVLILLNEDFDFLTRGGDRSLSRYRALAERQLGASCPVPGAPIPADELAATLQDWVDHFENAHLIVRLSTKLRQRYGD